MVETTIQSSPPGERFLNKVGSSEIMCTPTIRTFFVLLPIFRRAVFGCSVEFNTSNGNLAIRLGELKVNLVGVPEPNALIAVANAGCCNESYKEGEDSEDVKLHNERKK